MSTAENQDEETRSPADAIPETKPPSGVWPRGVHSTLPASSKMDEPHAEQLTLGILIETPEDAPPGPEEKA